MAPKMVVETIPWASNEMESLSRTILLCACLQYAMANEERPVKGQTSDERL